MNRFIKTKNAKKKKKIQQLREHRVNGEGFSGRRGQVYRQASLLCDL